MKRIVFRYLLPSLLIVILAACGGGGGGDSSDGSEVQTDHSGTVSASSSSASSNSSASAGNVSSSSSSASESANSSASASSVSSGTATTGTRLTYEGVSLAGAEFGETNLPGTYGSDYTYPTTEEVDYFIGKGMNVLRIPFRWERLQTTLESDFDASELARLDTIVNYAVQGGAYVVLDPHNYARYNDNLIGSTSVSQDDFADLWTRLAEHFTDSHVIFALMNEPHDIDDSVWLNAANAAITAIRNTGSTNLVLVPGNYWTGAHSWSSTTNATNMANITDPGNNYAYEVHQYLDSDSSGENSACVSSTIGAERLADFTSWLKQNGKKGFLGEFAGGNNTTCETAVTGMLAYMQNNSDVWIGWTWWAAGPWWGSYIFTLEPSDSFTTDAAQMAWLTPYL